MLLTCLCKQGPKIIGGEAELRALGQHPALAELRDRIRPVLAGHQAKVDTAAETHAGLAENAAHLAAADLKQAVDAIKRVQNELTLHVLLSMKHVIASYPLEICVLKSK